MLIYARNQTFCPKSVNKAPKVQIFGLNTLCSILSNCTWKKFQYQNQFLMYFIVLWISYVFLCFFDLLFLLFFSPKFVADTFWSTINQKLINFSNWVKICIFIWTKWENSICIDIDDMHMTSQKGAHLRWGSNEALPCASLQIYVKPHLKNTQMTLEYQIFDEKARE